MELCHLNTHQAGKLLKRLKSTGRLQQHGERRWAFYTLNEGEPL
jgi:ATP-dependent DNA helicase RecG